MRFRIATRADVPAIVALLADDDISRERAAADISGERAAAAGSDPVSEAADAAIWAAFEAIDADPRNELIVGDLIAGEAEIDAVVATCQLTFTPGLSRGGAERMTIEAVRVRADLRGHGVGRQLMAYAVTRARDRNCRIVQLTTDKRRTDAQRFYASLGFVNSHEGMKLQL